MIEAKEIGTEVGRYGIYVVYKIKCPMPKCKFAPEGYNKKLMEEKMEYHIGGQYCKK